MFRFFIMHFYSFYWFILMKICIGSYVTRYLYLQSPKKPSRGTLNVPFFFIMLKFFIFSLLLWESVIIHSSYRFILIQIWLGTIVTECLDLQKPSKPSHGTSNVPIFSDALLKFLLICSLLRIWIENNVIRCFYL